METLMNVIYWVMVAFTCYIGFGIVAVWALFGIAYLKGWSRPDITPIEIIERLRNPK